MAKSSSTKYLVTAVIRPDVPKGAIGEDIRLSLVTLVQGTDITAVRKAVLELAYSKKYVVVEISKVDEVG